MGGRARRRRSGFRRQRPISRRVVLAVAVCPAAGRPSSPLAAALSDVGVFHVLDLGLRPNEPHRARCRSSASTSDEHVWLCASRAGRLRPRGGFDFSQTPPRVPNAPTATRRTSSVLRCAAAASRPGAVALFPRRGHRRLHPRLRSAFDLRPPRSSPLLAGELRTIRAELTIGATAVRSGFACAVNPGVLSGSPGAGG